jgi:putative DNA primase/helicase
MMPHSPLWVSPVCLPYDYDPHATCPLWVKFLTEVFDGDKEKGELLQEWFGYCLTHDTSLHKILLMVGVPRAGKGTIWDILRGVVGVEATAGFTLFQFTRDFGLAPLVDRMVAYCGEVELKGSHEKDRILAMLKNISGEDILHIDRKYQEGLHLVLPTRLVIACNEMPSFYETGGAFSSRLLLLQFNRSFAGHEDYALKDKLRTELAGISNWALEGLRRLRANGRFSEPTAMIQAIQGFKRDSSPTLAFIQDCLMVENRLNPGDLVGVELTDMELSATKREVEGAYRGWCMNNDMELDETKWAWFWKRMKVILPKLEGKGRGDERAYTGIARKEAKEGT